MAFVTVKPAGKTYFCLRLHDQPHEYEASGSVQ